MNGIQLISRAGAASMLVLACLVFSTSCGGGSAAALPGDNITPPAGNTTSPAANPLQERNGVTSAFGIPAGIEGNVSTGEGLYASNCSGCHGSNMGPRDFTAITAARSNIGSMKSLNISEQQQADITAYLNRASIPVVTNPPADPNPPAPPTDPTPPADPTVPSTDILTGFGIPAGMSGSISAGQQIYSNNCAACHSNKDGSSFGTVQSAIANVGSMRGIKLTQQELADLTAYLNRNAGGGGTGTGGSDDDDEAGESDDDSDDSGLDDDSDDDSGDSGLGDDSDDDSDDSGAGDGSDDDSGDSGVDDGGDDTGDDDGSDDNDDENEDEGDDD